MEYILTSAITLIVGSIILGIIGTVTSRPSFILKSKKLKTRIENAKTGLEFKDLCVELASLRKEIPDHKTEIMASLTRALTKLGKSMDKIILPEVMTCNTLNDLNYFISSHEYLYKEMEIFMPYGKFGRFSQYKLFPAWFLQERMKRLDIIEGIANKMSDPFRILELLYKETPTHAEATFPYFSNDEDEPIPMEIRKKVAGLFLETAKNADKKEIFINIFRHAGNFTDIDAIQELFITYIKNIKVTDMYWEWKSYIGGIIETMDEIGSPTSLLSSREYYSKLYTYLDEEKNSAQVPERT